MAQNDKQSKETPLFNEKEGHSKDPDNLFFQAGVVRTHYNSIFLVSDNKYLGTVNAMKSPELQLGVKITFITVPSWKSYVQISFKVGTGRAAAATKCRPKNPWHSVIHHKAVLYLGRAAFYDIKVKELTGNKSSIPNLRSEKSLHDGLSKHLVYQLDIGLNRKSIGQHGFVFGGTRVFLIFEKLKGFLKSAFAVYQPRHHFHFVVGSNHYVTDVMEDFLSSLKDDVPDYAKFYPRHLDKHFLQIGDYPMPENRPLVSASASAILDTWSKYTTAYGYGAIYKHKIAVNARTLLRQMVF